MAATVELKGGQPPPDNAKPVAVALGGGDGGGSGPIEDQYRQKYESLASEIQANRRLLGQFLGLIGFAWVGLTIGHAVSSSSDWLEACEEWPLALMQLVAHAVPIVVSVWFGYQILRAAERFLVPDFWVDKGDVETLKTMLGITSTPDVASEVKSLREAAETIASKITKS